ncbi:MAG: phosphate ABC transporter permease subunit PstC [Leptolyngbyaceae cyanobacterium SM1_1_3]|nr:phosphate ABC transporter permease subunit PstC [Leptolyngbyaceae cyanobacterium SM1_1_3]NJN04727.1 phosphate ABC transporter permease subunit PstC [Leptolyngbyaceae cyanobacterium RM1_1_2]
MTSHAQSKSSQASDYSPISSRSGKEKTVDRSFVIVTQILAIAVAGLLIFIAVQVCIDAIPAIQEYGLGFIWTSAWDPVNQVYGALPMIYGTMVTSAIALLFALPLGVGTAIFLSEGFLPQSIRTPLTFMVELLAAIPSIVYGLWGIFVLIPFLKPIGGWLHDTFGWFFLFQREYIGPGLFPASIILIVMILPIITAISRDSLASLPPSLRQASMGLGATRWTTIFRVLIPAAFSGIVGGAMLALGRAMGETMAVTLLIGNSNNLNLSILAPGNTIASLLANQFAEASGMQVAALMYAGLVLFLMTLIVNMIAEFIIRQVKPY